MDMEMVLTEAGPPSGLTFGRRLVAARSSARLTQKALAQLAGVNKETITRLEAGGDARITTIDKLKLALPTLGALPMPTEDPDSMALPQLELLATRVGHLVMGIASIERLHKVRAYIIAQLIDEQQDLDPTSIIELDRRQQHAEEGLVARGRKRKRTNGKETSGH